MEVEDIANVAIQEDLAHGVDVTTVATIPEDAVATADFTAREEGVVAGLRVAEAVLSIVCTDEFEVERHVEDGAVLGDVDVLAAEHRFAALGDAALAGQLAEQQHGLVGDPVLREVEEEPGGRG